MSTKDILGITTTNTYDGLGRIIRSSNNASKNVALTSYDDANLTTTNSLNGTTISKEVQDGAGNKLQVIKNPATQMKSAGFFLKKNLWWFNLVTAISCHPNNSPAL